jgi:hypothetical protein
MNEEVASRSPTTGPRIRRLPFVIGLGVAAFVLLWWIAPWHTANPITMTGTAYSNSDATAIFFEADSRFEARRWGLSVPGEGFVVAGALWTDLDGTTHDGSSPACLKPGETTPVELSFVRIRYWGDGGGPTRAVTHLRCLG